MLRDRYLRGRYLGVRLEESDHYSIHLADGGESSCLQAGLFLFFPGIRRMDSGCDWQGYPWRGHRLFVKRINARPPAERY